MPLIQKTLHGVLSPILPSDSFPSRMQGHSASRSSELLDSNSPILIHHDDPSEYDVPGAWSAVGDSVWQFPSDWPVEYCDAQYWLNLGNWLIYPASVPIRTCIRDTARSDAASIIDFLRESRVELIIDSFHDNDLWTVATYVA